MPSRHVILLPSWYPTEVHPHRGIFFREQALALHRAGWKVGVLFPDIRGISSLGLQKGWRTRFQIEVSHEAGFPEWRIRGWKVLSERLQAFLFVTQAERLFRAYIREHGMPDLLHAHSALWGGVAARRLARRWSIPYVLTEHSSLFARGHLPTWQQHRARQAFQEAARCLSVSRTLSATLRTLAPECTFLHVPNLVSTSFFTPPPVPPPASPFRWAVVAGLRPGKGLDILLEAFARAFPEEDVHLDIVGEGPERPRLEAQIERLGLGARVHLLGARSRAGVREVLWRAHALVHPSLYETFGVVLIEAMATGLPVVATRCGGPEDVVTPATGLLVPPGAVKPLAEALREMYRTYPAWAQQREAIRTHAVQHFSEAAVVEKLRAVYDSIVG